MSLTFAAGALAFGKPIATFLLKRFLGDGIAAIGDGLAEIAQRKIADAADQRSAAREFEAIGDKIVKRLVSLFSETQEGVANAVAFEIGKTLQGNIDAKFFVERDLNPAKLSEALREVRPLPLGRLGAEETSLYDRALDESVRYLVGIAQDLPHFDVQTASTTLARLSRIGEDLDQVLDGISRIERLVAHGTESDQTKWQRFEGDYRQAIARNLDYLELFGADISSEAQRQALSVGYVSLNLSPSADGKRTKLYSADSLLGLLASKQKRLLIRGDAGSGKSTLLRWLAIRTAHGELNLGRDWNQWILDKEIRALNIEDLDLSREHIIPLDLFQKIAPTKFVFDDDNKMAFVAALSGALMDRRLPFLVRLRDCPAGRLPAPNAFPTLIANEIGAPPEDWVKSILQEGRALLLLDGIDEVPNVKREQVRHDIEAIVETYPNNHYVVTTRPTAVREGWLGSLNFDEASINPMSQTDQEQFVKSWHTAVQKELSRQGRVENLAALAEELIGKISENLAISRLANNPLLCAVLCALHRERHQKLPESQSELCEAMCQLLLHRRELESGMSMSDFPVAYRSLSYEQKRATVQEIAHFMVRNDESTVASDKALTLTGTVLSRFPNCRSEDSKVVLTSLIERSGVLREFRPGFIDFIHNTIKEFLAAEMFVNANDVGLLASKAADDGWRYVVLFASATRDRTFASALIPRILSNADRASDKSLARRAKLSAVDCRHAALHLDRTVVEQVALVEKDLIPPQNMSDAEALAGSGDAVVPRLTYSRMDARKAAACVRTLRLIGTPLAKKKLGGYLKDTRQAVVAELAVAIDPLSIKTVQDRVIKGDYLGTGIGRNITSLSTLPVLGPLKALNLAGIGNADLSPLGNMPGPRKLGPQYFPTLLVKVIAEAGTAKRALNNPHENF